MNIREEILKVASTEKKFRTSDVLKAINNALSRQGVSATLTKMVNAGSLIRQGTGGQFVYYALPQNAELLGRKVHKRLKNNQLKEHEVYDEIRKTPFISSLGENVLSILAYAFSEMLNNAIEHSSSDEIDVEIEKNDGIVSFIVRDYGIGVFKSVMSKRHLQSELEAIQEIMKGKTTTLPHSHSGEGIFFTSKVGDVFILESFNYRLRIDNLINDIFIEVIRPIKGTRVTFNISDSTKRHLNNIFKAFQTSPTSYVFDKTEIRIKLYNIGTIYISRSQARRVLESLEKFKLVILDFDQVPTIGQAFADEIFRVFAQKYPETVIQPENMNEAVRFMVERVAKPRLSNS